ncbi:MAG: hypothetical protein FJ150_07315 [Euryarchaeota archaeon]|nr:hypothetical protein [Euryarchaeota archaeon]
MINLKTVIIGLIIIMIFYVFGLGMIGDFIGFFIAGIAVGYLNDGSLKNGAINGIKLGTIGFTIILILYLIQFQIYGDSPSFSFYAVILLIINYILYGFMSTIGGIAGAGIKILKKE